ncbi:MAG: hypothetical protein FH753_11415 [Firmicutes bacterium]|nr:hypothetical protein [Bacillota bacterium]
MYDKIKYKYKGTDNIDEKENVMEKILKQILSGLKDVKKDITVFKNEMHDFKDEMIGFKDEMYSFKDEMIGFKDVMYSFKDEMIGFKDVMHDFKDEMIGFKNETTRRLDKLEIGQRENRNILRSLEHASEVSKAQRDRFTHDITEIKGDIKDMKKDITKIEFVASSNWNEIIKLKATK